MKLSSSAIASILFAGCAAEVAPGDPPDAAPDTATAADAADAAPVPDADAATAADNARDNADAPADTRDLSHCWNPPGDPGGCTPMGCERYRLPGVTGEAFCYTPELCCAR